MAVGTKERLTGLDLLRFFAASLVMLYHLGFQGRIETVQNPHLTPHPPFPELAGFAHGWVGVQIFFVISGFVIAYSAEGASAYGFLRSRFIRLAPTLWFCSSLTFCVILLAGVVPLHEAISLWINTVFLWPVGPWIDGASWTLVIEVIFYSSILLLLMLKRFSLIERAAMVIGVLSAVYNVTAALTPMPPVFMLKHLVHFSLGILLWLTYFKGATPWRWAVIAVCVIGGCAEVYNAVPVFEHAGPAPVTIWLFGVGAICLSAQFRRAIDGLPGQNILRVIGLATYPLYLFHGPTGKIVTRLLYAAGANRWVALGVAVATVLGFSFLFVTVIEPPIKALFRRLIPATWPWTARVAKPS